MTKTKRLSIKLLPSDKALLDRLAKEEGEACAVIVRRMIRKAAAEAGLDRIAGLAVSDRRVAA